MRRAGLLFLLPLTGLVACDTSTVPSEAGPDPASGVLLSAGQVVMVPFSTQQGLQLAPDAAPLTCAPAELGVALPNRYEGSGVSTYLGRSASLVVFESCTIDLSGASYFTAAARTVWTAANGDELRGTGIVTQYADGDFTISQVEFTGGTGRFSGVTGSGAGGGWIDLETFAGHWGLSGTISQPNR